MGLSSFLWTSESMKKLPIPKRKAVDTAKITLPIRYCKKWSFAIEKVISSSKLKVDKSGATTAPTFSESQTITGIIGGILMLEKVNANTLLSLNETAKKIVKKV